jgi:hypothetical protein
LRSALPTLVMMNRCNKGWVGLPGLSAVQSAVNDDL